MEYSESDWGRVVGISQSNLPLEPYRTAIRRDFARLIHSPSFRRLVGKTQLFPGSELDFFRNRLTHSLEVAQIAKSIAARLNYLLSEQRSGYTIDMDLVEFAALAHDLGHPPFGHLGEEALDEAMMEFGGFEGNAQTLRILTKIEKKQKQISIQLNSTDIDEDGNDKRVGLNLSYRCLASILKYDYLIPENEHERERAIENKEITKLSPVKGYYETEKDVVEKIKAAVLDGKPLGDNTFKTIECSIMDLADDIAYSTYDLEDSFKGGFINPLDLLTADGNIMSEVTKKVNEKLKKSYELKDVENVIHKTFLRFFKLNDYFDINPSFREVIFPTEDQPEEAFRDFITEFSFITSKYIYDTSKKITSNGYARSEISSRLIGEYMRGIDIKINEETPKLSSVTLPDDLLLQIEILKRFTYEYQINSNKLRLIEYRGKDIVRELFDAIIEYPVFLPTDYFDIFKSIRVKDKEMETEKLKNRIICDFIACMTDDYAIEFYGRLKSENPQTIFKPLF